jgi:hypothetical protein
MGGTHELGDEHRNGRKTSMTMADSNRRVKPILTGPTLGYIREVAARYDAIPCPGCGAPCGYPPAGPCMNHGAPDAYATNDALSDKEHSDA